MKFNKKTFVIIILTSIFLSLTIGTMDYETVSILDLFKNWNNILGLLLYAIVIAIVISIINGLILFIRKMALRITRHKNV